MRLWCAQHRCVEELTDQQVERLVYHLEIWSPIGEPVCLLGLADATHPHYRAFSDDAIERRKTGGHAVTVQP